MQSMRHPTLAGLTEPERLMECAQIDVAIDRADTVRWLIRDDRGTLESSSQRSARHAANVFIVPLSILLLSPGYIPSPGHEVLDAADARLRDLLKLKRSRGCSPRTTCIPGMNDIAVLAELESLQAKLDAKSGDEDALLKKRTRLLDGLRIVPPPSMPASADDTKK